MVAARDTDLSVFVAWLDLLAWLLPTTAKLPKHFRFTFGCMGGRCEVGRTGNAKGERLECH